MTATINASNSGSGGLISTGDASGSLALQTAGTTAVTIDTSQNVGIGTSSPADKLHVAINSSSLGGIRVQNTNASGQAAMSYYNDAGTQKADIWWNNNGSILNFRTLSTDPMVFSTNNSERMRIDSSGNVLLGCTSAPSTSVAGAGFVPESVGRKSLYLATNSTGATVDMIYLVNPNGTQGKAGTNATGSYWSTSSDYRLKENVQPMQNALNKVALLKPCTYTWKSTGSDGQGFIAHELAEVVPEAVIGTKDAVDENGNPDYQGIDTGFLVATLTAAIQEQQALITAQAETLSQQAALINALTARVEALENKA